MASNSALAPPSEPSARWWVFRLALGEVIITLATAALVTLGGPSGAVNCPSFPSCLTDQSTWIATAHQAVAGALLVLALVIVVLAAPLRRKGPPVLLPSVLALLALAATASVGMLLASGVVPVSYAPIQFAFLAVVILLFAWTARNASRPGPRHCERGSERMKPT